MCVNGWGWGGCKKGVGVGGGCKKGGGCVYWRVCVRGGGCKEGKRVCVRGEGV